MKQPIDLWNAARLIFATAVCQVDAAEAVRKAVSFADERLLVAGQPVKLNASQSVYAIALGKAAPVMAAALSRVLGDRFTAGIISGPENPNIIGFSDDVQTPARWKYFPGGHPLPTQQSLNAAQASFELLQRANRERATVLYLISGGGSAMMEWPSDERITLADLREANRLLVSCGASIAEINAVRRAISAVKGGRLAARAPLATQLTLIISDTNEGDEASVASGPTIATPANTPDARRVILTYERLENLPSSVLRAINNPRPPLPAVTESSEANYYVLLDNRAALAAAAETARRMGFLTEVASDIIESEIAVGCEELLSRLANLRARNAGTHEAVCLISGGEFLCPVRGTGIGGRNAETVLRWAIAIDQQKQTAKEGTQLAVLSAGTDGIDGNSPAAGAFADTTTLARARALNIDAHSYLNASDAFTFFDQLRDTVVTGATATNVRDLRILLAR